MPGRSLLVAGSDRHTARSGIQPSFSLDVRSIPGSAISLCKGHKADLVGCFDAFAWNEISVSRLILCTRLHFSLQKLARFLYSLFYT